MQTLEELRQEWVVMHPKPEVQQRIWDCAAPDYREHPVPEFENDNFLKRMEEMFPPDQTMRTLDVGCGSGVYSMALAHRVKQAVGVDISPRMIEFAKERAERLSLSNTEFRCMDWASADIDSFRYRGAFDIVFAHMTPAVCDYPTLDKLNACSKGLCMLEKPTRRRDRIQDEAFRRVGIGRADRKNDSDLIRIFAYLWYQGYCPSIFYQDEVWDHQRSTGDTVVWCTERARLQKDLTAEDEETIRSFVESQAENSMVREIVTTTRVTMAWRVIP